MVAQIAAQTRRPVPSDVEHRQIKYRNNVIECDHGKLKRIINATLGFKSMKTAYATIKGIEVMRAPRKGQPQHFIIDPRRNAPVSRVFEMGPLNKTKTASSLTLQQCPHSSPPSQPPQTMMNGVPQHREERTSLSRKLDKIQTIA